MSYNLSALPLVPLRGMVVFPKTIAHLDIGRDKSIKAVEAAMASDRVLAVVAQRDDNVENPKLSELAAIGTIVKIRQMLRLPGGIVRIQVEGMERLLPISLVEDEPFYVLEASILESSVSDTVEMEAYRRLAQSKFGQWAEESKSLPEGVMGRVLTMDDAGEMADLMASYLLVRKDIQQDLLNESSVNRRLNMIIGILNMEMQIADLENSINSKVRQQMEKAQKEYFLREKIKTIREELGDKSDPSEEAEELKERLRKLQLEASITERIEKEIARYEGMSPMMPEANVLRNYLEWVLSLPWNVESEDRLDIKEASASLEADHYGLEKVKERILEFLAVKKHAQNHNGSILCLVGPPGVGKTSLAQSIAKAMNRKFIRASLGGVRDEAEIRGHRRTYIGALPGRMIQGIKNAGTKNPVFLLDEIDKLGADYKGDPSSALLEVLDPEQNKSFSDHFIEIPFDFSEVFWITTANIGSNIPAPLLDRMEIIELSSYTEDEKVEIAKRYLLPKQIKKHGLQTKDVKVSDSVLRKIITDYTREAGVRSLEKQIAKLCRKVTYKIVEGEEGQSKITLRTLDSFLGAPRFLDQEKEKAPQVGLVCGLAWTSVGGVVLPCEAAIMEGTGKLILTGSLGKVMQESAQAALSYIRSQAEKMNLPKEFHKNYDIHIHLPEGATPKDGPSAGITMTLAMISALTKQKVRADLAMTGEITIRGRVLPIGGLKEKLLAALRNGIKEVLIPKANEKDIPELPAAVRDGLIITPVKTMDDVLAKAFKK